MRFIRNHTIWKSRFIYYNCYYYCCCWMWIGFHNENSKVIVRNVCRIQNTNCFGQKSNITSDFSWWMNWNWDCQGLRKICKKGKSQFNEKVRIGKRLVIRFRKPNINFEYKINISVVFKQYFRFNKILYDDYFS